MATPDYLARKPSASLIRSSISYGQSSKPAAGHSPSPSTPLFKRSLSSQFGSPSSSFRAEDDCFIYSLGSRFLHAGFMSESRPRCILAFGPGESRRAGDYRQWAPDFHTIRRRGVRGEDWGRAHELYRLDVRDVDLGLMQDKLERAIRQAQTEYFMVDSARPRKIMLAVSSALPRPLLLTALGTLFQVSHASSITLLSTSICSVVAAGLRSALVVDIGWAETIVTAVYEYREVGERRSVRAGKVLSLEMAKVLNDECARRKTQNPVERGGSSSEKADDEVSVEEAEGVLTRVGWCQDRDSARKHPSDTSSKSAAGANEVQSNRPVGAVAATEISIPLISIPLPAATPPITLRIPFNRLSSPADTALFALSTPLHDLDDHDLPLHQLVYKSLLSLPPDIRALCMARIVLTGGVSQLPGLKSRVISEVATLVRERGWDPVQSYGSVSMKLPHRHRSDHPANEDGDEPPDIAQSPQRSATLDAASISLPVPIPASQQPQEPDPVLAKLRHHSHSNADSRAPTTRGVETLGAWAGASLIAGLRVKGVVEIEKDDFAKNGLRGTGGVFGIGGVGGVGGKRGSAG
ncbi:hypothetical protein B0A49_01756 [Cryomyces minteri]|uniref:Actin-like ATPase domain-containing protein n=1 Tax=Cryomyces minteri TaxID=331657 RepID=A0A4U0XVP4_9PEZI|nr:hypothetical protein B0A49_01756 [Cryomyces minteri]